MSLKIIYLEGSPEERGRRHGAALGAEIRRMRRVLLTYLVKATLVVGAVPLIGLLVFLSRGFWPYIPGRLKEELQGVAAGASLDLPTVLLINLVDDIANNCPRCSALAVGPARTDRGSYLTGRNLDYPLFTDILVELQTLFMITPEQGWPMASLAWPGYIGVCTGLNRAGVALWQLSSMSRDTTLQGMPAALRFRQALELGGTVDEVAEVILKAKSTVGNNVMLAAAREAAVLELSARRGVKRSPVEGLLTVTNHYQTEAMAPVKGRFPRRPPGAALSEYHFSEAYSRARDARLQELAAGRRLNPAGVKAILADEQVANPGTVVSLVCSPAELTLWVARGRRPPVNRGPVEEIKVWG